MFQKSVEVKQSIIVSSGSQLSPAKAVECRYKEEGVGGNSSAVVGHCLFPVTCVRIELAENQVSLIEFVILFHRMKKICLCPVVIKKVVIPFARVIVLQRPV